VVARTQAALYAAIDDELSWSEQELPERERTKHVHRLHPYLGKFPPQLGEVLLRRGFAAGDLVYDPFAGSGTTLVEANALGMPGIGCDVSAFNCLMVRVKAGPHDLAAVRSELDRALEMPPLEHPASGYLAEWLAPPALAELRGFASAIESSPCADVLSLVASRAARSARLVPHHDLDWAKRPVRGPYSCHKHRRTCRPVEQAAHFLRRYAADTLRRLEAFAALRTGAGVTVLHADARTAELPDTIAGVVTSPPYPGLIDYHEQHRYAYELLGLEDRREQELGAAAAGTARSALAAYADGMVGVFDHARRHLRRDSRLAVVVNDRHRLYDDIATRAGLRVESRVRRHVNRRTGRRAGEFYEEVLWLAPRPVRLKRSTTASPAA
jgi:hypothetical protein